MSLIPREIILLRNRMLWLIYGGIYPPGFWEENCDVMVVFFLRIERILEIGIGIFIGIFTR